jgi:hypothetical protein
MVAGQCVRRRKWGLPWLREMLYVQGEVTGSCGRCRKWQRGTGAPILVFSFFKREGVGPPQQGKEGRPNGQREKWQLRGDLVFCFKGRGAADLWFASPREERWPAALSLCGVLSGLLSQSQRRGGLCVDDRERESLWSAEKGRPNGQGGAAACSMFFPPKREEGAAAQEENPIGFLYLFDIILNLIIIFEF